MRVLIEVLAKDGTQWSMQTVENVIGWTLYGTGRADEAPMLAIRTSNVPEKQSLPE